MAPGSTRGRCFFFRGMLVMACDDHLLLLGMVFDVFYFLMFVERTFVHPKRVFFPLDKKQRQKGATKLWLRYGTEINMNMIFPNLPALDFSRSVPWGYVVLLYKNQAHLGVVNILFCQGKYMG